MKHDFSQALADSDACLEKLSLWPMACRPPAPARNFVPPEAPTLDDHTFINPHEVREDSWLMKQSGVQPEALPDVPDGWEWKRDATSPIEDSWVAVKKTLTKDEVEMIRGKILAMQEACFARKIPELQELIQKAKGEMLKNTGPSAKAIKQAEDFVHVLQKLEAKEEDERRLRAERVEEERRTPIAATGLGFPTKHPLQKARRRLCAKVNLRRARALEALGDSERAITTLKSVLRLEPKNPDALEMLVRLKPVAATDAADAAAPAEDAVASLTPAAPPEGAAPAAPKTAAASKGDGGDDLDDDDD